jgi:HlyD family secretion protein
MVSAQIGGQLLEWRVAEGQFVSAGDTLGHIDTTSVYLQKRQLIAQMDVLQRSRASVQAEGRVLEVQITSANRELDRVKELFSGQAATQKQLDDADSAVLVLESRLAALQTQLARISAEREVMIAQLDQLQDQLNKAVITSPIEGTVLMDYVNAGELVALGKPLFSVANLQEITLRAFMDAEQIAFLQLNQSVRVFVDGGSAGNVAGLREYPGRVSWISSKAEFTPRTIQTREDRVTLVYAVKVVVENDGFLKIGMPGEMVVGSRE